MVIEVDNSDTWPPDIAAWIDDLARDQADTKQHADQLDFSQSREDDFLALFTGHLVRAYHCTRLLDCEAAAVRAYGLAPLSLELLHRRIGAAVACGALTAHEGQDLAEEVVAAGYWKQDIRQNVVFLFTPRRLLDVHPDQVWWLLNTWGGEAIYGPVPELREGLSRLGRPTIVVTDIDVTGPCEILGAPLQRLFLATKLGLEDAVEFAVKTAIPPAHIAVLWQPGDAEYDRHADLPRP